MDACSDHGLTEVFETYEYPTTGLHSFILILFEKYSNLLEKQFGKRFKEVRYLLVVDSPLSLCECLQIVERDDSAPMQADDEQERNGIMNGVWLVRAERERLLK